MTRLERSIFLTVISPAKQVPSPKVLPLRILLDSSADAKGKINPALIAAVRSALPDCELWATACEEWSNVRQVESTDWRSPEFVGRFDLIVPLDDSLSWPHDAFIARYQETANQDKLWLVPGNNTPAPMDEGVRGRAKSISRVTVVTSCFNYGDYFSVTAHFNRPLVERLIVVTSIEDRETMEAAWREGCEAVITAVETPNRPPFRVIGHKNYFINRALQPVGVGEWLVHLDSDILLPPYFREFLAGREFENGFLYGAESRRLNENEEDVLASYADGPWQDRIEKCRGILGFFGLFQRTDLVHPVPEGDPNRDQDLEQDDHLFAMSFEAKKRMILPFEVMHLGSTGVNWRQRTSSRFERDAILKVQPASIVEEDDLLLRSLLERAAEFCGGLELIAQPLSRRADRVIRKTLGALETAGSNPKRVALAVLWEEHDLHSLLRFFRGLDDKIDQLVIVGKELDHRYHPRTSNAVRFLLHSLDYGPGEGWLCRLAREELARLRKLCEGALAPTPCAERPVLALGLAEETSPLDAIPWMESVAAGAKDPVAFYSGDRAGDLEVQALLLGFALLPGELVSMQGPPFERRALNAAEALSARNVLMITGVPDGEFDSEAVDQWLAERARPTTIAPAQVFSNRIDRRVGIDALMALFHRLRISEEGGEPVHIVTSPYGELEGFFLRLATWPLAADAVVHLCETKSTRELQRLASLLKFTCRFRRCREKTVAAELRKASPEGIVLAISPEYLCRRTAFLPRRVSQADGKKTPGGALMPNERPMERWGWTKLK